MPALAFGLNSSKPASSLSKPAQKRKIFDTEDHSSDDEPSVPAFQSSGPKKSAKALRPLNPLQDSEDSERPRKSLKLSDDSKATKADHYANLSALRSAKLHDEQASQLDSSVYSYDDVYDTLRPSNKPASASENNGASGPKYMTSLLSSAEQRKRDLLRAREKVLQRERELEGDEFAGKEKFVTSAYKQQQEETRALEEEEKKRVLEEEKMRGRGVGMLGFNKKMLEREEERMKGIEELEKRKKDGLLDENTGEDRGDSEQDVDEEKEAKERNSKGGHVVVNDEGEVIDKRQLLSAGLNTAPKKSQTPQHTQSKDPTRPQEYQRTSQARNARESQRERQTRMMERQIEEIANKQEKEKLEEEKQLAEKNKSRLTQEDKMGARERFLARKREREMEEEARKGKGKDGG